MAVADQLRTSLSQARGSYGGQFAGQPRATRSVERLQALIDQVRTIAADADGVDAAIVTEAQDQLSRWTDELAAIQAVQAAGPNALQSSHLSQWARDGLERYQRNFAGQSRSTRDTGILEEIVKDLERRVVDMEALLRNHDDTDLTATRDATLRNIATYRNELQQIRAARADGTLEQRAGRLAGLANGQFNRYRLHFAGKSRLSRRREVLERIISALQEVRRDMVAVLDAGVEFPQQKENIGIVDGHLKTYHREVEAIRGARNNASRGERIKALAEAANAVFSEYRNEFPGFSRATRDETKLNDLWEQLWPVALDMEDLAREDDAEPVSSNLQKVRDSLRLYEREWRLIREAKGTNKS
ncbi:MAG: hypothetical protein AB8H79_05665 [Myxococcota bacterium]